MTTDEALAELRAARAQLYEASAERDRLALQKTRYASSVDTANARIVDARTRVQAARLAVIDALRTADDPVTP